MKQKVISVIKKPLVFLKNSLIVEFQYRFLGKTGYGDNLLRLRKFRVCHKNRNCSDQDPVLYLTVDVEWGDTPHFAKMLDTLKEKQVCAYLFLLGKGMEENAHLVQRIVAEGHCVGNHAMTHLNLTKCTKYKVMKELRGCEATFYRLTGQHMPKVLRPPFGRINRPLAKFLFRKGYSVLHWSLHVPDYAAEQPVWSDYETYYSQRLHNGGIILQHSFSAATAENLGRLIDLCREKGYRFAEKPDYDRLLADM